MGAFIFTDGDDWIIKINEDGIIFNHYNWPNAKPDDFAQAFIDILERKYKVKFIKDE